MATSNIEKDFSDIVDEVEGRILPIDDGFDEETAIYDAFLCFAAADVDFVRGMVTKLEDPKEFGLRLFVPGRNKIVGESRLALATKIISERCRHMIVVLSPCVLQSPACKFLIDHAFGLSQDARDKKIVPIKIEDCRTPDKLLSLVCCDFTNDMLRDWSWKRLAMSIM